MIEHGNGYVIRNLRAQIDRAVILNVVSACVASLVMGLLVHSMMWKAYSQGATRLPNPKASVKTPVRKNDRQRTLNA